MSWRRPWRNESPSSRETRARGRATSHVKRRPRAFAGKPRLPSMVVAMGRPCSSASQTFVEIPEGTSAGAAKTRERRRTLPTLSRRPGAQTRAACGWAASPDVFGRAHALNLLGVVFTTSVLARGPRFFRPDDGTRQHQVGIAQLVAPSIHIGERRYGRQVLRAAAI